jgi:hypothetical protein
MTAFTQQEIDLIRARYPTEGAARLVDILGKPKHTIIVKAHALGLRCEFRKEWGKTGHQWTLEEDALLRKEWPLVQKRQQSAARLADKMGVSITQLRLRTGYLGLRIQRLDHQPWTEEEDELLAANVHLALKTLRQRFKRAGYRRTEAALALRRGRLQLRLQGNGNYYSGQELAALLGCSLQPILRWIRAGWLLAKPRGETENAYGGPGDRYLIAHKNVRKFIIDYTAHAAPHLATADKVWLVDLLTGGGE